MCDLKRKDPVVYRGMYSFDEIGDALFFIYLYLFTAYN